MSRPVITVAPVVVRPEIDSKIAPTGVRARSGASHSGMAPNKPSTTQNSAVTMNPSRIFRSRLRCRVGSHSITPANSVVASPVANADSIPSLAISDRSSDGNIAVLNRISKTPMILNAMANCIR